MRDTPAVMAGFLLAMLLVGCASPRPSSVPAGEVSPRAGLTVEVAPLEVSVDTHQSLAAITALAHTVRDNGADGATLTGVRWEIGPGENGRTVTLKGRATVLVARELEPGSCRYDIVLDHEFRHVNALQRVLDTAAVRWAQQLKELDTRDAPLRAILAAWQTDLIRELDRVQVEVDSPREAARIDNYCHHNLPTALLKKNENGWLTYAPDTSYADPLLVSHHPGSAKP